MAEVTKVYALVVPKLADNFKADTKAKVEAATSKLTATITVKVKLDTSITKLRAQLKELAPGLDLVGGRSVQDREVVVLRHLPRPVGEPGDQRCATQRCLRREA